MGHAFRELKNRVYLYSRCKSVLPVLLSMFLLFLYCGTALAVGEKSYVSFSSTKGAFVLSSEGRSAPLVACSQDYAGVLRVLKELQSDIYSVTGARPDVSLDTLPKSGQIVIAGVLGKNRFIDGLVRNKKLDVECIKGKWESFLIQVIEKPFTGVERALVIAGSDKRGAIYGIYDLSTQIGVSPWYWWADVPVLHRESLYVNAGKRIFGPPSVKYRGIFLNDEYPDLTKWVTEKFGTVPIRDDPPTHAGIANYNSQFYSRIFELILRLRGNYLWPAMWNNAFNEDDPENPGLADEYGIVMGTSHQEPMLRAQKEWDRRFLKTLGTWNYATHPDVLENFWREGIRRNKKYESMITIGLRGANDTPMAPGGPEKNKALLEKIVDVQRKIISEEMDRDVTKVPQMWCLYKETQEYYNAGMRVPDDVVLLWAEDNWGNVRRLPTLEESKRSGGAGVYYHFDYHGGPRSYQWINTSPIPKIWDQLSLAKQYGADRIWIVNVGHFKGYEFPMEYFFNLAWNTDKWTNENLDEYTLMWAGREFGAEYAPDIADIISRYTKYNGRRKPELLSPMTYSQINYHEAERVTEDYNSIYEKAETIYGKLPENMHDAFYELVLFPVKACAIVNELYFKAGKNALYAKQGRACTNDMASDTRELFGKDTSLMGHYNRELADGKWDHFMDQSHLGYTNWQDPPENSLRAIELVQLDVPGNSLMGVTLEGTESVWPGEARNASLPVFDKFNRQERYIDVFNKGSRSFRYGLVVSDPWISVGDTCGTIEKEKRLFVRIDWDKIPAGDQTGKIKISGAGRDVDVEINVFNPDKPDAASLEGFVEGDGFVSMEAAHYSNKTACDGRSWIEIEDYGHTLSGMRATAPAYAPNAVPGKDSCLLEYRMYLFKTGKVTVTTVNAPTLNFMPGRGLRYAVSFDGDAPQTVTLVPKDFNAQHGNMEWEKAVADNCRTGRTEHVIAQPGYHVLRIWMVDQGVVMQKIIVDTGGLRPSYLGPPESYRGENAK